MILHKTQQSLQSNVKSVLLHHRSFSQSRRAAPAANTAASIPEDGEKPDQASTSRGSSTGEDAPKRATASRQSSGQASDTSGAAAKASTSSPPQHVDRALPKQQALIRSLSTATAAFAFGGGDAATAPKLTRSVTGVSPAAQPFAFGNTAAPIFGASGSQVAMQFGRGQDAASAGTAAGGLFGFAAPTTAKSVPSFGTGAFGGLGLGFSFVAGNSFAPHSLQTAAAADAAPQASAAGVAAAAAAVQEAEQEGDESGEEMESVEGNNEGEGEEEADQGDKDDEDQDDSHFALPDDLLSEDEEEAAAAGSVTSAEVDSADELAGESAGSIANKEKEAAAESQEDDNAADEMDHGENNAWQCTCMCALHSPSLCLWLPPSQHAICFDVRLISS